jgi:hypothetical protein
MDTLRTHRQRGASLIMLIGIVAALAILAATLVTFIGNVQSNTADQRVRDKAAGVSEAAVDGMMYQMSLNWPNDASTQPVLDATTVRSQFSTTEYPNPPVGSLVSAVYYDNSDTNGDGNVNRLDAHYDANGDNLMYVEGQGMVGARSVRIQALVRRTFVDLMFRRGVAVYTGANLTSNGLGNNPKITIEDQGGLKSVTGYVAGALENPSVFQSTITQVTGGVVPPLSSILPDSVVLQVIALAKNIGTYYDLTAGAQMPTDISGVKVIKVADGTTVNLGNNDPINSAASPGILFILGGNNVVIDMGGNATFWGVMYTEGTFQSSHGTPSIHGMLICKSNLDMKGTPNVYYNDSAIAKLANKWTLAVQIVANTWREISPVAP